VSAKAPITLDGALNDYKADLEAHQRDPANAQRCRPHLTDALLAKPVMVIEPAEWSRWRNALVAPPKNMNPATVNRMLKGLRAALTLAANNDRRIDREVWRKALANLPDKKLPREYVVTDDMVLAVVTNAYRYDENYGVLIEVEQQTGARMSQVARIRVSDL